MYCLRPTYFHPDHSSPFLLHFKRIFIAINLRTGNTSSPPSLSTSKIAVRTDSRFALTSAHCNDPSIYDVGRIESAVPWMNALIFTTSSGVSLSLKSGIP